MSSGSLMMPWVAPLLRLRVAAGTRSPGCGIRSGGQRSNGGAPPRRADQGTCCAAGAVRCDVCLSAKSKKVLAAGSAAMPRRGCFTRMRENEKRYEYMHRTTSSYVPTCMYTWHTDTDRPRHHTFSHVTPYLPTCIMGILFAVQQSSLSLLREY